MARSTYSDLAVYRRLLAQARPYWPHITGLFVLDLLAALLALLGPLPLKIAIDSVIGSQPVSGILALFLPGSAINSKAAVLILAASLVVVLALLTFVQEIISSFLSVYASEKMITGFRADLFRHVQRLSLAYHDSKGTADSAYRIQYDAPAIQDVTLGGVIPFIGATVTLAGMIFVTARIDWTLAVVALLVTPALFFGLKVLKGKLRSQWSEVKNLESSAIAIVQEVLGALRVVKSFGQEDREHERFVSRSNEKVRARLRVMIADARLGLVIGLTTAIGTASVLYLGARHVQSGAITLGELLLVMAYLSQLYGPIRTVSRKVTTLQSSLASAERAFVLLDEAPDVVERSDARRLIRAGGAVTFRNVSFTYVNDRPVLRNVSFEVPTGTRVGIIGKTGAGKTTLMNLLTRFYDPREGAILLDGIDLRDYNLTDLRNQFAIVLQEPVLFSTSIRENIAYARPQATEDEIIAAAKAANVHEFVSILPEGYETVVGERGMSLSGGERQRISLARAFLKDAPMLLLDEPTSAVDVQTETAIMDAMDRLMQGRTSFMITHRPSTMTKCNLLFTLENGKLCKQASMATPAAGKSLTDVGFEASQVKSGLVPV